MKDPKYPKTPMRNCLYCRHYNNTANACSAPNSDKIAVFNPDLDKDCMLLSYEKTETPKSHDANFENLYCLGKQCPYFFQKLRLCTRPSKCPYKPPEYAKNVFSNTKID